MILKRKMVMKLNVDRKLTILIALWILDKLIMLGMFLSVSFGQEQTKYGLGFEFHTFPSAFMEDRGGLGNICTY